MDRPPPSSATTGEADALRVDGRSIHIRPLRADDRQALLDFDNRASDRSLYLHYFSASRYAADTYIQRLVRRDDGGSSAIGAVAGGEIVGVASFARIDATTAEFSAR